MPAKIGSKGIIGLYKGSTPFIKMYRGSNLVFQKVEDNQLPWVEANVKKFDYSTIAEEDYYIRGGYDGVGIILSAENLEENEIISFTYDGVTKTIEYYLDENGDVVNSGKVIFAEDVSLEEGVVRIESNIPNTGADVYLCPMVATIGYGKAEWRISCFNGGDIVGNYAFDTLLSLPKSGTAMYIYGHKPQSVRFNTNYIGITSGRFNNKNVNIAIGNNVKNIASTAFGDGNTSVEFSSITFENRTNKKININETAFNVKSASNYNVYIYDNDSALYYDWRYYNSGASVYNNGVLLSQITTPTTTLDGENLVINLVEGASEYKLSFSMILNGSTATFVTYIKDLSNLTIPISSIKGYENMVSGSSYTITTKAYGKGYLWSSSTSVSYTKP